MFKKITLLLTIIILSLAFYCSCSLKPEFRDYDPQEEIKTGYINQVNYLISRDSSWTVYNFSDGTYYLCDQLRKHTIPKTQLVKFGTQSCKLSEVR
jgi:thioredoxin-related protein